MVTMNLDSAGGTVAGGDGEQSRAGGLQQPNGSGGRFRSEASRSAEHSVGKPWPWVAQFAIVLVALGFAFVLVLLPILIGLGFSDRYEVTSSMDIWGPMVSTLLGLTSMTVAGIFVFMTFRIDRGVKHEVREEVREYIGKTMKQVIAKEMADTKKRLTTQIKSTESRFEEETKKLQSQVAKEVAKVTEEVNERVGGLADEVKSGLAALGTKLNSRLSEIENNVGASIDEMEQKLRTEVLEANLSEEVEKELKRLRSQRSEADDDDGSE